MTALPDAETPTALLQLPVDQLHMGLDFRLDEDPEALAELAASITEHGILQPLVVRHTADGWEVAAGRRRLAAARLAELTHVPCLARTLSDDQAADIALTENLHRRSLSPIEEGLAYARLRDQGLVQREIAARVGMSQKHVSTLLSVLDLPDELRSKVHARTMRYTTALRLWGRTSYRATGTQGSGPSTSGRLDGSSAAEITYWRRRHERLHVGLQRAVQAHRNGLSPSASRQILERLLEADSKPIPGEGTS